MRKAKLGSGSGLRRGVYVAEWTGENGEMILVAVTSDLRRIGERLVPFGANSLEIADELCALLDEKDPDRRASMRVI